MAGGLAVREQSTTFQGTSFAGNGAGGALSSSFWNSAAISQAAPGLTSESSYTLLVPNASVTSQTGTATPTGSSAVGQEVDFGRIAALSSSYYAYRLSNQLVAGMAINAPFGLANEFDDPNWAGQMHGRSGKIFTLNANPMLSYNLTPTFALGIGAQIQYAKITFKAAPASSLAPLPTQSSAGFEVDDIGFGGTAGALWTPVPGTTFGVGYRSPIKHTVEGDFFKVGGILNAPVVPGAFPFRGVGLEADITLPEMVTLSLRHELTKSTRLLATVEWTNWSRLQTVDFKATSAGGAAIAPIAVGQTVSRFDFNWDDGWFFALGGEYDYSPNLTLRGGVAYEISPIRTAEQRFTLITDSDRVWVSAGFNYKITQSTSVDVGYSHIFFDDAPINRATTTSGAARAFVGFAEQSVDILSVGLKTKW